MKLSKNQKAWVNFIRRLMEQTDLVADDFTDAEALDVAIGMMAPTLAARMPEEQKESEAAIRLYVKSMMALAPPDEEAAGGIDLSLLKMNLNKN